MKKYPGQSRTQRKRFRQRMDDGIITPGEFERKKQELLKWTDRAA